MPRGKKVSPAERRQWLEEYDRGARIDHIATRSGRDTRTVNKGIKLAADERDRSFARAQHYQTALENHNGVLLRTLAGLRGQLAVVNHERVTPLAHFPRSSPVVRDLVSFELNTEAFLHRVHETSGDGARLLELLREHLMAEKNHWLEFDLWTERHSRYLWECYCLGHRVGQQISERTSLEPEVRGTNGFTEGYVSWICRLAIEFAEIPSIDGGAEELLIVERQLRRGGALLAESESPEKLAAARDAFTKLVSEFAVSNLAKSIARKRTQLEATRKSIDIWLGDFELLGIVPGRCQLCGRLGL